ncbi:MAG TPA: Mur ligase family protein [Chloroflexota bacterium]|nr:Mur ligase family protein [Chloroflexota bacterium]
MLSEVAADASPEVILDRLSVPSRLTERPSLEPMWRLLDLIGNPQVGLPVLHVGGTAGKGSTATIAAQILQESGYRVGLHVKPHLERVEERFVLGGQAIEAERLSRILLDLAPAARAIGPTWYELTVAAAFRFFQEEKVDLAVVEVGLGGTYDGTNVVQSVAAVLTNVGLDHTEILGDTVDAIARDKVGIAKPGVPFVSGVSQPVVAEIVRARCQDVAAPLWQAGRDFSWQTLELRPDGARFNLELPSRRYGDLELALLGQHQVHNAVVAVAGVAALERAGFPVAEAGLRTALRTVRVPGRLEVVRREPLVVLDGAHNPDKMLALVEALTALYPNRSLIGVLAFKRGHHLEATIAPILSRLSRVIVTTFDATTDFGRGQAVDPDEIAIVCARLAPNLPRLIEPDPSVAVRLAISEAAPNDVVCVTGSLYLVGAVRPLLRSE